MTIRFSELLGTFIRIQELSVEILAIGVLIFIVSSSRTRIELTNNMTGRLACLKSDP